MGSVAHLITRKWVAGLLALFAILGAGAVIGLVGQAESPATGTAALPNGTDSRAAAELRDQLPQDEGSAAVVLYSSDAAPHARRAGRWCRSAPARLPGATGAPPVRRRGRNRRNGVRAGRRPRMPSRPPTSSTDLRAAAKADLPEGLTAQVTGPAAIQADLAAVFDGANFRLLAATASVVAILLVITYRSPFLWLVPLTVVGGRRPAGRRARHPHARGLRRALGRVDDRHPVGARLRCGHRLRAAAHQPLPRRAAGHRRTGATRWPSPCGRTAEAVLSSATTVVLGLLTLLLSLFPATRGLGLACAVGVVVAATFALVVLPAALVVFGRWIFWPKVPHVGQVGLADGQSFWRRVGDAVAKRPAGFVTVTVIALGVMAGGITQIQTGLDEADQFLQKPEAIAAGERLAAVLPGRRRRPGVRRDPR